MASEKITATQLLLPVSVVSFVLTVFLSFQTSLLFTDRDNLQAARAQQEKPLEQLNKIKEQVNGLAVGTLRLAKSGDKNAQAIMEQMKKAGINVQDTAPAAPAQP